MIDTRHSRRTLAVGGIAVLTLLATTGTAVAAPIDWTVTELPDTGVPYRLAGVDALATDDAWAVGVDDSHAGVAVHWDGTGWQSTPLGVGNYKLAVTAVAEDDVWAVGGQTPTMAAHWDGTAWTDVPTPEPDSPKGTPWLYAADAAASDDVWAVGNDGALGIPDGTPFLEHWDGTDWTVSRPALPEGVTEAGLSSVIAVDADEAWAFGVAYRDGVDEPLVLRWDGTDWSVEDTGVAAGTLTSAVVSDGTLWAVGFAGSGPVDGVPLLLRRDTDGWTTVNTPQRTSWWYGLAADGAGGVIATGYDQDSELVLRSDGRKTVVEADPVDGEADLTAAVNVPGTSVVWVVGKSDGSGLAMYTK